MRRIDDRIFDELRRAAIEIWETYDDTYGYATEKIRRVNSIINVLDNYGTIIGMFDSNNQRKLYQMVGDEAKDVIREWLGEW